MKRARSGGPITPAAPAPCGRARNERLPILPSRKSVDYQHLSRKAFITLRGRPLPLAQTTPLSTLPTACRGDRSLAPTAIPAASTRRLSRIAVLETPDDAILRQVWCTVVVSSCKGEGRSVGRRSATGLFHGWHWVPMAAWPEEEWSGRAPVSLARGHPGLA
jgi:hypothetical protein